MVIVRGTRGCVTSTPAQVDRRLGCDVCDGEVRYAPARCDHPSCLSVDDPLPQDMTQVDLESVLPQTTVMVVSVTGSTTSGQALSEEDLQESLQVRGVARAILLARVSGAADAP